MPGFSKEDRGAIGTQRDAIRKRKLGVDLLECAVREIAVEPAYGIVEPGTPRIREIEHTVLIEKEIIRTVQRRALVVIDQNRRLPIGR